MLYEVIMFDGGELLLHERDEAFDQPVFMHQRSDGLHGAFLQKIHAPYPVPARLSGEGTGTIFHRSAIPRL